MAARRCALRRVNLVVLVGLGLWICLESRLHAAASALLSAGPMSVQLAKVHRYSNLSSITHASPPIFQEYPLLLDKKSVICALVSAAVLESLAWHQRFAAAGIVQICRERPRDRVSAEFLRVLHAQTRRNATPAHGAIMTMRLPKAHANLDTTVRAFCLAVVIDA